MGACEVAADRLSLFNAVGVSTELVGEDVGNAHIGWWLWLSMIL